VPVEAWRRHYNALRLHSALGLLATRPGGGGLAGCATPTRSAGHPTPRDCLNPLTFRLDHHSGLVTRTLVHQFSTRSGMVIRTVRPWLRQSFSIWP
jgi:hypothetical protein